MKIFKRVFALTLVLVLALSLMAGCSGKDGDGTASTDAPDLMEGITNQQVELFGDLKGTKLRVADEVKEWEVEFYKQLEEQIGMKVEIENLSSAELNTKIAQAVASADKRNYFDVGITANSGLLKLIYANLIIPMDNYIYYDDPVWKYSEVTDFNSLDLYKLDGHYWGAPSNGYHENFIFYNKTYFQEVGAPDPYEEYYLKDNWTFETFLDTCAAVTKKDGDGNVQVAAWATWNYFAFSSAAGNDLIKQNIDSGEWEIILDQPEGLAGLNVIYESAKNGWLYTTTSGYEEFVQRKVAMLIEKPSSAMGGTDAYSRMSDEIGIVPFPKMDTDQEDYICPMTVSGYYIAACAQNPRGAAAYIYYHRIGEVNNGKTESGIEGALRLLNEEAQGRRNEYIQKCKFAVPYVDGLEGWYSEARNDFLDYLRKDMIAPAVAADSMINILRDCLRKTVI